MGVDHLVPGIERNREQRSSAPLQCCFSFAALLPHFCRAAAIDDVINLFVQMPLRVQRSRAWHFDDVHAPEMFGAEELNRRAPAAEARPRAQWGGLDFMHTDVPVDRDALCFHEEIIGGLGIFPFAETGLLSRFWFAPLEETRARLNAHIAILLLGRNTTPSRIIMKPRIRTRTTITNTSFHLPAAGDVLNDWNHWNI